MKGITTMFCVNRTNIIIAEREKNLHKLIVSEKRKYDYDCAWIERDGSLLLLGRNYYEKQKKWGRKRRSGPVSVS